MTRLSKLRNHPWRFFVDFVKKRAPRSVARCAPLSIGKTDDEKGSAAGSTLPVDDMMAFLGDVIPADNARQTSADRLARQFLSADTGIKNIIELGCGAGNASDWVKSCRPDVEYVGVDIEWSPQVARRARSDVRFVEYDGINLPFEDSSIDMI